MTTAEKELSGGLVVSGTARDRLQGLLLGTAVGDSLGLPAEGLSRRRAAKMFPGALRQRLVLGRGMVSDDTEHNILVGQALLGAGGDLNAFVRRLAWGLRFWLLGLPAGCGLATGRAIFKLWFGVSPAQSGVYSAGNGPSMRAGLVGAYFAEDPQLLDSFLGAATRMTHSDPKALIAARAVAQVAAWVVRDRLGSRPAPETFLGVLRSADTEGSDSEWREIAERLADACRRDMSVAQLAEGMGLDRGVTGYAYHTVPVALYAWYRHFGDFAGTVESVIRCGGDADTVAAIAGGLAGAVVGEEGIPTVWLRRIVEWPRGVSFLRRLADGLAAGDSRSRGSPARCFWPAIPLRNLFFLAVVLAHGFRRLLPPWGS